MSATQKELTVSKWLRNDPDYFTGWYRIQRDQTQDSSLEAGWYGLWNSALFQTILNTELPKNQFISLHPQFPITELLWPEDPLENHNDDTQHVVLTRSGAELEEQLTSLSLASSSVLAIDNISAASTNPSSVSSVSQPVTGDRKVQNDKRRFPDWALMLNWIPNFLPSEECVFLDANLPAIYHPYLRVLFLVEVKRIPSLSDSKSKEYIEDIEDILNNKMRQQVYQQVRFAFAEYQQQNTVVHISAVGDYCKIRRFKRDYLTKKRLIPENENNKRATPSWKQLSRSGGSATIRLMPTNSKDIHPLIKKNMTEIHNILMKEMEGQHEEWRK
ncbi:hypothetical protein BDY19DRAFT_995218 [Irpex rosettiformis]|uniref:Uncharacterized protein n=1 Tax=Irpex rosettiformis TaxID=378272 RepID=A0ACB8TYR4_9APHY|nr:hypothetical protein BDY19DRAFT_995218 [Irpex rosettiformis]